MKTILTMLCVPILAVAVAMVVLKGTPPPRGQYVQALTDVDHGHWADEVVLDGRRHYVFGRKTYVPMDQPVFLVGAGHLYADKVKALVGDVLPVAIATDEDSRIVAVWSMDGDRLYGKVAISK